MSAGRIDERAKQRVGDVLRAAPKASGGAAAGEARQLLLDLISPGTSRDESALCAVRDVSRGSMLALIVHQADVAQGAVKLLHAVAEAAFDRKLDPTATL